MDRSSYETVAHRDKSLLAAIFTLGAYAASINVLHSFVFNETFHPLGVVEAKGWLPCMERFSITEPHNSCGGVFRLHREVGVVKLHAFTQPPHSAPCSPYSGLTEATDGRLYGVTNAGGDHNVGGAIYRVSPGFRVAL
jgi:hypothetical protein